MYRFNNGARKGSDEMMFWPPTVKQSSATPSKTSTYTNVEFDRPPQHQHCRVSVAVRDDGDLRDTHDGADGREDAQREEADHPDLLRRPGVQRKKNGDGKHHDDDVACDGEA